MADKKWAPRRPESEDELSTSSSDYIQLDEGEKFLGVALFDGDITKSEPGFYAYFDHYGGGGGKGGPCPGPDDCPDCADGDKPRARAKTLWNVLEDAKGNKLGAKGAGEIRVFNASSTVLKQFNEIRAEGEKVKGRTFRVSHPDKTTYTLMPKTVPLLKAAEVKGHLSDPPDLENMVVKQLQKRMEGVALKRVLEDDDDETPTPAPAKGKTAGKGKAAAKKTTEPWPDEAEDLTVVVVEVEDEGNYVTVKHEDYEDTKNVYTTKGIDFDLATLSEDDDFTFSGEQDGDGDYILSAEPVSGEEEPEADAEGEENDLPDAIEGDTFVVGEKDESASTIEVTSEDGELAFTLYFLDTMKVDFDDFPEGAKINVTAEKDRAGDLVATEIPEVVVAKKTAAKKAAPKSGAAKKAG